MRLSYQYIYLKASEVLANFVNKMQCCSNIYLPVAFSVKKPNYCIREVFKYWPQFCRVAQLY